MVVRPPKNPTETNRRFWGVDGQTIGLDTEPWYPPTGTEIPPMTDKPVIESQHPPTSARAGVTERITAMDTTSVSSRGLTGAPENRMETGAPENRDVTPAKPAKSAKAEGDA